MTVLTINAGSSSLKFALFEAIGDTDALLARGMVDWHADPARAELTVETRGSAALRRAVTVAGYRAAVGVALDALSGSLQGRPPGAVGHRVVHGGARFTGSIRVDAGVREGIARLGELAPLHNPAALEALDAVEAALPGVGQVAVFDTSFYASFTPRQYVLSVPYEWLSRWGVRRFGFHGISHAYCASRALAMFPDEGGRERRAAGGLRVVTCHLGSGSSATASRGGVAVATTMGFTPLDGLMMGTRPGSLDPGVVLYVETHCGLTPEQVDQALNHESGLLGVSGVSADFREVEASAAAGVQRARLALDLYADRVRAAIGALAVAMGGVDVLVFTAGVGENSASLRAEVCAGLDCLGLRLDARKNAVASADADVAEDGSPGRIVVMRTDEERMIARETMSVLGGAGGSGNEPV